MLNELQLSRKDLGSVGYRYSFNAQLAINVRF